MAKILHDNFKPILRTVSHFQGIVSLHRKLALKYSKRSCMIAAIHLQTCTSAMVRQVGQRFPSQILTIGRNLINTVIIAIFLSSVLVFLISECQEDALNRLAIMGMGVKLGLLFILVPLSQPSIRPVIADLLRRPGTTTLYVVPTHRLHRPAKIDSSESIPGSITFTNTGSGLQKHIIMENCCIQRQHSC